MNNKKRIVNLKYFIEMLKISLRILNQQFDELPFKEEILAFLKEIGHSGEIKMITDEEHKDAKKSNEMYYPRFTKVIINFFMAKDQSILRRNKVVKPAKEKQPAKSFTTKGLTVLYEVALTEVEQIKLATKRILTQTHISHASRSGVNEGTGIIPGVLNLPNYESDDEEISWKSSEEDDDNNDDEEKI
nr:hypothetical protein [Tanacetum cinerariifolium]GFA67846.1 hypothetical protein [Tanacetum cinerariifolium]